MEETNPSLKTNTVQTTGVEPLTSIPVAVSPKISFLKRYRFFLIGALVLSVVLIVVLLIPKKTIAPPVAEPLPTITPQDSGLNQVTLGQIFFAESAQFPQLPEKLFVYKGEPISLQTNKIAQTLAVKLSLTQSSTYLWASETNQGKFLSLNPQDGSLVYVVDSYSNPQYYTGTITKTDTALGVVNNFIKTMPDLNEYVVATNEASLLKGLGEVSSVIDLKDNPNLISFSLYPTLDSLPLKNSNSTESPLYFFVNSQNIITKIKLNQGSVRETSQVKSYNTLNEETAKKALAEGRGQLISLSTEKALLKLPSDFNNINITRVFAEYRFSPQNLNIVPYYRFVGIGINPDQSISTVNILLPAIQIP
jgi:hypothetical protein